MYVPGMPYLRTFGSFYRHKPGRINFILNGIVLVSSSNAQTSASLRCKCCCMVVKYMWRTWSTSIRIWKKTLISDSGSPIHGKTSGNESICISPIDWLTSSVKQLLGLWMKPLPILHPSVQIWRIEPHTPQGNPHSPGPSEGPRRQKAPDLHTPGSQWREPKAHKSKIRKVFSSHRQLSDFPP